MYTAHIRQNNNMIFAKQTIDFYFPSIILILLLFLPRCIVFKLHLAKRKNHNSISFRANNYQRYTHPSASNLNNNTVVILFQRTHDA